MRKSNMTPEKAELLSILIGGGIVITIALVLLLAIILLP